LKKAGFASHTEKINTAKGEKIRLKAGNFSSRQAAVSALSKLKSENLSGMVISND
jgi:DedD protein